MAGDRDSPWSSPSTSNERTGTMAQTATTATPQVLRERERGRPTFSPTAILGSPTLKAPPNPVRLKEARRTTRRSKSPRSGRQREVTVVEYSEDDEDDDQLDESDPSTTSSTGFFSNNRAISLSHSPAPAEQEPTPPPIDLPLPLPPPVQLQPAPAGKGRQPAQPLVLRLKIAPASAPSSSSSPATTSVPVVNNRASSTSAPQRPELAPIPAVKPDEDKPDVSEKEAPAPTPATAKRATPVETKEDVVAVSEPTVSIPPAATTAEPLSSDATAAAASVAVVDSAPAPRKPAPKVPKPPPGPLVLPPTPPTRKAAPQSFAPVPAQVTARTSDPPPSTSAAAAKAEKGKATDGNKAAPTAASAQKPVKKDKTATNSPNSSDANAAHVCANCGATSAPAWRRGPDNESLCNACGIYFRNNGRMKDVGKGTGGLSAPATPSSAKSRSKITKQTKSTPAAKTQSQSKQRIKTAQRRKKAESEDSSQSDSESEQEESASDADIEDAEADDSKSKEDGGAAEVDVDVDGEAGHDDVGAGPKPSTEPETREAFLQASRGHGLPSPADSPSTPDYTMMETDDKDNFPTLAKTLDTLEPSAKEEVPTFEPVSTTQPKEPASRAASPAAEAAKDKEAVGVMPKRSKSSSSPKGGQRCTHCKTTETPTWRRQSNGDILCNACGLYYKYHNSHRPLASKLPDDQDEEGLVHMARPAKASAEAQNKAKKAPVAKRETDEPPNKKVKQRKQESEPAAAMPEDSGPAMDEDMDPESFALIQSLLKDAPMSEKVKMGRRKATGPESKSFAIFGEDANMRSRKSKPKSVDTGASVGTEATERDAVAEVGQAEDGPEGSSETTVDNGSSIDAGGSTTDAGVLEPSPVSHEESTPLSAAPPSSGPRILEAPIVYVPGERKSTADTAASSGKKRKRWDMAPEKYIESQLEGLLENLRQEDQASASRTAAMLAEYATNESLFHFGACFLRLEACILRDEAKFANALEFAAFAERKAAPAGDWVLGNGKSAVDVKSSVKDIRNFVQGVIAWIQAI